MAIRLSDLMRGDAGRYDTGVAPLEVDARYWRPKPLEEIVGPGSTRVDSGGDTAAQAQAPGPAATPRRPWESPLRNLSEQDWREIDREIVRGTFSGAPSRQDMGVVLWGAYAEAFGLLSGLAGHTSRLLGLIGEKGAERIWQGRALALGKRAADAAAKMPAWTDPEQRLEYELGRKAARLAISRLLPRVPTGPKRIPNPKGDPIPRR
jgi:hypothetical protein